jgi:hypothetical protein
MKNFILGYMVAAWSWPTIRTAALKTVEKFNAEREAERAMSAMANGQQTREQPSS